MFYCISTFRIVTLVTKLKLYESLNLSIYTVKRFFDDVNKTHYGLWSFYLEDFHLEINLTCCFFIFFIICGNILAIIDLRLFPSFFQVNPTPNCKNKKY